MKRHLTSILVYTSIILLSSNISAQEISLVTNTLIEKGDKQYHKFGFDRALQYYKQAFKNDSSISLRTKIANTYRELNDQYNAEIWYAKLIDKSDTVSDEVYYYYANALESNRKYDQAQVWYEKYLELSPKDDRAIKKIKGLKDLSTYFRDSSYYEITPVVVNSKAQDFSPTYYKDGIVFVSGRKTRHMIKGVFNWDNSSYLDLFYSEVDEDEHMKKPVQFNKRVNTKYHEGPLAFYNDFEHVVFTRNAFYQGKESRSSDDINKLKMYFAKYEKGAWKAVKPFQYNDDEYSVGHPTISPDGAIMVFVSDMPGSVGGTDLWMCYQTDKGWSEPKSLGENVNTIGNEMFPYWNGKRLYFSSDGYDGLGGLDVYEIGYDGESTSGQTKNLGAPINSSKDDFGYLSKDGRNGYFSSNRRHELYDDMYHFSNEKPHTIKVKGLIEDERDLSVISKVDVFLIDDDSGDTLQSLINDRKGRFEFDLPWDAKYRILTSKTRYTPLSIPIVNTSNHQNEELIVLMKKKELIARVIAVDEVTGEMIPKPHIIVLHPNEGHSLVPRNIDVDTSEFVIEPNIIYDVAGAKRQYFTKHVDRFSETNEYGIIYWEVPLGEIELDKAITLDNIYYDVNKSNIRPDAAKELDKLLEILKSNPTIKIELSSHTDSRGSDIYNKSLSQKRAESAVQYLIDQHIDPNRLVAVGAGEEMLTNECANGINCSAEMHQKNRRTEFKVTSF